MRRISGVLLVFSALALIPRSVWPQEIGEARRGTAPPPGEILSVSLFHPPEPFPHASLLDGEEPPFADMRAWSGIPLHPRLAEAFDWSQLQKKIEPWLAKISSAATAGIRLVLGTAGEEGRDEFPEFDALEFEGAADIIYRPEELAISEFSLEEPEPRLTLGESVFSVNVEEHELREDQRVSGEFQWMFGRNVGLFLEYRIFRPEGDRDTTGGKAAASWLDTDVSSHRFLGGFSFRF